MHLALLALGVGPGRRGDHDRRSRGPRPRTSIEHCRRNARLLRRARGRPEPRRRPAPGRSSRSGRRRSSPCTSPASPATSTRSTRSASRSSRMPRTRSRAATAAASSAGSPTRRASRSTRRRTSPRARAGSSRRTATDLAERIRSMRLTRRGDGSRYDQVTWGFKANLSDVLAAIALVQLDKLERHTAIRERQFALYDEGLADLDGITPLARDPRDTHALHLYVVRIDPDARRGHARRLPARARRGADRDEHPLPPRAPAHVVPRALPRSAAAPGRRARGRRGALAPALAGARRRRHPRRGRRGPARARAASPHEALRPDRG